MNLLFFLLAALTFEGGTSDAKGIPADIAGLKREHLIGHWEATHPRWRGRIELQESGRFARAGGDGGRWQLKADVDPPVLELDWDEWAKESARALSPNLFKGAVRDGEITLKRMPDGGTQDTSAEAKKEQQETLPEFHAPELKAQMSGSVWEMKDGKQFTLHADGSTTGSWHERKGTWRIVAPETVELHIWWRKKPPEQVKVEKDATILRWSDESFGGVAKRLQKEGAEQKARGSGE
jgi:hypothetical protein